jgi:hypothetical protein
VRWLVSSIEEGQLRLAKKVRCLGSSQSTDGSWETGLTAKYPNHANPESSQMDCQNQTIRGKPCGPGRQKKQTRPDVIQPGLRNAFGQVYPHGG